MARSRRAGSRREHRSARVARGLASKGKQVVMSSQVLLESGSDVATMHKVAGNGEFTVEANDMGAINMLAGRARFVAGPNINTYNAGTLAMLAAAGARRWVLPVELDRNTLRALQAARPAGLETEVFAFGRLPLAFSARCFTARAHNLPKDECGFRCGDYADGMLLSSQEDKPFLVLNGIQTQSAETYNLVAELPEMKDLAVDVARISPQSSGTFEIINTFHAVIDGTLEPAAAPTRLAPHIPYGACNGHWYGQAGMNWIREVGAEAVFSAMGGLKRG